MATVKLFSDLEEPPYDTWIELYTLYAIAEPPNVTYWMESNLPDSHVTINYAYIEPGSVFNFHMAAKRPDGVVRSYDFTLPAATYRDCTFTNVQIVSNEASWSIAQVSICF